MNFIAAQMGDTKELALNAEGHGTECHCQVLETRHRLMAYQVRKCTLFTMNITEAVVKGG